jgi:hypothetical protein
LASSNDEYYRCFINNQEDYWGFFEKNLNRTFSDDFKTLFSHMINPNPENRASLADVLASDWFNSEEVATLEDAKNLYAARNL